MSQEIPIQTLIQYTSQYSDELCSGNLLIMKNLKLSVWYLFDIEKTKFQPTHNK